MMMTTVMMVSGQTLQQTRQSLLTRNIGYLEEVDVVCSLCCFMVDPEVGVCLARGEDFALGFP